MPKPVILSACRTPIGKFGKSLVRVPAARLGEVAVREAIERSRLPAGEIEEVILGNVISAGLGQNLARQAAIYAGVPVSVGSFTLNKVCGSGLKAVMLASQAIKAGDAEVLVAAGIGEHEQRPLPRQGASLGD